MNFVFFSHLKILASTVDTRVVLDQFSVFPNVFVVVPISIYIRAMPTSVKSRCCYCCCCWCRILYSNPFINRIMNKIKFVQGLCGASTRTDRCVMSFCNNFSGLFLSLSADVRLSFCVIAKVLAFVVTFNIWIHLFRVSRWHTIIFGIRSLSELLPHCMDIIHCI